MLKLALVVSARLVLAQPPPLAEVGVVEAEPEEAKVTEASSAEPLLDHSDYEEVLAGIS